MTFFLVHFQPTFAKWQRRGGQVACAYSKMGATILADIIRVRLLAGSVVR